MSEVNVNYNGLPGYLVPIAKAFERNYAPTIITTPATVPVETAIVYNELHIKAGDFSSFLIPQARQLGRFGFKNHADIM